MDMLLLLLILFVLAIIFFIISIIKKVIKIAFILAVIFVILFLVTGGSIMSDFNKLKEKIENSSALVLLEDRGEIITGFIDIGSILLLDSEALSAANDAYKKNELKKIQENHYKIFIIKPTVLSELTEIKINNKKVTHQEALGLLLENNPILQITFEDFTADLEIANKETRNMPAALFADLYEKEIKMTKNPIFFFKNYKEGEITVYPETIFFKFTKLMPLSWLDANLNKLKTTIKDELSKKED